MRLATPMSRSHDPPMCEEYGELNSHVHPFSSRKRVRAQLHVRPPPDDSDDSCLCHSAGSDEEYLPKPGYDESSSESDMSRSEEENVPKPDGDESSSEEEVVTTSGQAARQKQKRPNKEKVAWKTVKQTQSSAKNVPMWQGALPDNDSIRLPRRGQKEGAALIGHGARVPEEAAQGTN
ncbi:histone deacetylase HDT3-like [Archocentrus centrarchus]|uniref:histone deacetylase HDT3-like n=1 Tax=Archocentrus centrarchus TaxID=63155 RepID=UPI0011EA0031|nr:histone deacetylase HDT3-like [Archocentrus centrarchus]